MLTHRSLISLKGSQTVCSDFLQGLVTNDMDELTKNGQNSIYTFFLDNKGRVLFDAHIYAHTQPDSDESYLIECDKEVQGLLLRHIKKFKLRNKFKIVDASDELAVCAYTSSGSVSISVDPRFPKGISSEHSLVRTIVPSDTVSIGTLEDYHLLRTQIGIGEGAVDFPVGECFPLESNLEIINGVSFSKGCYLGQELTARTYHTGVTRKRLMPVRIKCNAEGDLSSFSGAAIKTSGGKSAGKLRTVLKCGNNEGVGLALVRLRMLDDDLMCGNDEGSQISIEPIIPKWWPSDCLSP